MGLALYYSVQRLQWVPPRMSGEKYESGTTDAHTEHGIHLCSLETTPLAERPTLHISNNWKKHDVIHEALVTLGKYYRQTI